MPSVNINGFSIHSCSVIEQQARPGRDISTGIVIYVCMNMMEFAFVLVLWCSNVKHLCVRIVVILEQLEKDYKRFLKAGDITYSDEWRETPICV